MGGRDQVNPDLQNLIALQDLDQKITKLKNQIQEIPTKSQNLKDKLQGLQEAHESLGSRLQELGRDRRVAEGDVELLRTKLSRLREQLMIVKTNKEYAAMLREIQGAEDHIRMEEDKILELMEESETMEVKIAASQEELNSHAHELEEHIRKLQESIPVLELEVGKLMEDKGIVEADISIELLDRYRLLRDNRKGVALAEAIGELCSACHVRVRPQVYAELLRTDTIFSCDSCDRILFLRDAS